MTLTARHPRLRQVIRLGAIAGLLLAIVVGPGCGGGSGASNDDSPTLEENQQRAHDCPHNIDYDSEGNIVCVD